jgi:hypothetical protein
MAKPSDRPGRGFFGAYLALAPRDGAKKGSRKEARDEGKMGIVRGDAMWLSIVEVLPESTQLGAPTL